MDEIQAFLDSMRVDIATPGISIAVVNQDESHTFTSGLSDQENQIKMNPDHVLMNGSIGKTYVAAVVLNLIDDGKLRISDPISTYLSDYRDLHRIPNANELTIDHLMTHTSGIPRYIMDPSIWSFVKDDPLKSWTPEERLAFILDADPVHKPGEDWAYSDTNYILLGMIVEAVTGIPYNEMVLKEIIEPQGLEENVCQ